MDVTIFVTTHCSLMQPVCLAGTGWHCLMTHCQDDCRYQRLAKIPISFNRAVVNFMSAIRLCPAGVKDVHDMLVGLKLCCVVTLILQ